MLDSHPWKRFFARIIDIYFLILSIIIFSITSSFIMTYFIIGLNSLNLNTNNQTNSFILYSSMAIMALLVLLIIEPLSMSKIGYTPGKWLYGIQVTDIKGNKLNFSLAVKRTYDVYFRGCGLGIPIISLICNYLSYRKLKKEGITSWDQKHSIKVTHSDFTKMKILLTILVFLFIFLTEILLRYLVSKNG